MFCAPILYLRNGLNMQEIITICNVKVAKRTINAFIEPLNISRTGKQFGSINITNFTAYFSLRGRSRSLFLDGEFWSVCYVMDTSNENFVGFSFKSGYS